MRTFAELRKTTALHHRRDAEVLSEYMIADSNVTVWVFNRPADVETTLSLHKFAHLWIHRDYDHDAWHILDVDVPVEVGSDFVVMPGRIGNTLESFTRSDERAPAPPRLAELQTLIPKLVAAASEPADQWIAGLVASRIEKPDFNTVFVWADQQFYIQDLAPSRMELDAWQELPASQWKE